MDIFIQQLINGLTLGAVYALVALGYTMVYGIINLINFAHGEVVMIGTLTAITVAGSLLAAGMPPALAGLAALRRALGAALDGHRPLCRYQRLRGRGTRAPRRLVLRSSESRLHGRLAPCPGDVRGHDPPQYACKGRV